MSEYTNQEQNQASDWIAIRRSLFEHPIFAGQAFSEREAWIWLITKAAWKSYDTRVRGQIVPLERGQLLAGRATLAKAWGWGEQRVRTFLKLLETSRMVKLNQSTNQLITVVTICNYDKFQFSAESENQTGNQEPTRSQPEANHIEQGKQDNNISSPRARANCKTHASLPYNGLPMPDFSTAYGQGLDVTRDPAGRIVLSDTLRTDWLVRFGGDEASLDLALIEAGGCIQSQSRQPLRGQVERVLARKAADKHDRDQRYAKAAASRPVRASAAPRFDVFDVLAAERAGGAV